MMDFTLSMPTPEGWGKLEGGALLSALRANSPSIALLLINAVRDRTPHDTGALAEDETQQAYTGSVSGAREVTLVKLYTEDSAQLSEWGRVYAAYQEGPPLGLTTYTNEPHQMFFALGFDNLGDIEDWALATLQDAIDELVAAFPIELIGTAL